MYRSKYFIPTLMNDPSDADTVSSKLMIRSGMIRKLASGIYEWLPLGLKVLKKIEEIVREKMNEIGGQEVLLPIILPREYWDETGRWEKYGKELIRFKDRKNMDFCLAPTHEEIITALIRNEIRSYKELPKMFYQFGFKYRDELRPRFGVIRAREFYMKDAYSFHTTDEDADEYYKVMCKAYSEICQLCGSKFKMVEAVTGLIGGKLSHEFMVLADTGEEKIAYCDNCGYSANVELAKSTIPYDETDTSEQPLEEVYTPNLKSVDEVSSFLNKPAYKFIKCLIYLADGTPISVLIRGDREVNETKLKLLCNITNLQLADFITIERITKSPLGFAGPVHLNEVKIVADESVLKLKNAISGANKKDYHLMNINVNRDYRVDIVGDIKNVCEGDRCKICGSTLFFYSGIEVAHTFKLGNIYSKAMDAVYLDKDGKRKNFIMGCYGVGVSRMVAAIIEQHHDTDGIKWPIGVAPFHVIIIPINPDAQRIRNVSIELYNVLSTNSIEVMLDDRDERAGVKFKDADLIGFPIRIVVSERSVEKNCVEIKNRYDNTIFELQINELVSKIKEMINRCRF